MPQRASKVSVAVTRLQSRTTGWSPADLKHSKHLGAVQIGFLAYACAAAILVFGAALAMTLAPLGDRLSLLDSLFWYDALRYEGILEKGYDHNSAGQSNAAFFPGYPVIARGIVVVTRAQPRAVLFGVSHACQLASLVLLSYYVLARDGFRDRGDFGHAGIAMGGKWASDPLSLRDSRPEMENREFAIISVITSAFLPIAVFNYLPYAESMLMLLCILTMIGIARRWPPVLVALIGGAASGVRPVGVAVCLPIVCYAWNRSQSWRHRILMFVLSGALSVWGLVAYVSFQAFRFGEPLAFATTQRFWHGRPWHDSGEKLLALLTLEPIWSVFTDSSPAYWRVTPLPDFALFNWQFINAVAFSLAVALVTWGAWKRWLFAPEGQLAFGLLAIPYVTRAYENCLFSHARFAAVVFPAHLVIAQMMLKSPVGIRAVLLALAAFLLGAYACLYSLGHVF